VSLVYFLAWTNTYMLLVSCALFWTDFVPSFGMCVGMALGLLLHVMAVASRLFPVLHHITGRQVPATSGTSFLGDFSASLCNMRHAPTARHCRACCHFACVTFLPSSGAACWFVIPMVPTI